MNTISETLRRVLDALPLADVSSLAEAERMLDERAAPGTPRSTPAERDTPVLHLHPMPGQAH